MDEQLPFTKRIPAAIETGQRLAIEGLAVACELIGFAFNQIQAAIAEAKISGNELTLSELGRLQIFSASWSIINRIDAIRQLLHHQKDHIAFEPSESQAKAIADANTMRVGMDHAHGTIQRLKNQKTEFPIFGVIGWVWFAEGDLLFEGKTLSVKGRNAALLSISGTHHKWSIDTTGLLNDQIQLPWGPVNLWAFGKRVVINELAMLATAVNDHLNNATSAAAKLALASINAGETPIADAFCVTVRQTFDVPCECPLPSDSKSELIS